LLELFGYAVFVKSVVLETYRVRRGYITLCMNEGANAINYSVAKIAIYFTEQFGTPQKQKISGFLQIMNLHTRRRIIGINHRKPIICDYPLYSRTK
jgi:hypothetical protein